MSKRYSPKAHKASQIQSWLTKFQEKHPGIAYKLAQTNPDILKGMTLAQIQFTLSMTACAYGVGGEETRQFWAPKYHKMREAAERATGDREVSFTGLRLVASNG